ncbi:aminodeoxychorismate lyase [Vibrio astriarenae]|jgi:4-amino-4-deoxychorismate lyase
MIWINGEPRDTTNVTDRSFQYGDGVFTTLLVKDQKLIHWDAHQQRLIAGLTRLHITPPDWHLVSAWIGSALKCAPSDSLSGIKVHISRGSGGRGYSPLGCQNTLVTVSGFTYPTHYLQWFEQGVELGICQQRLGINPLLAGIKHNNRLEQVLLKSEMDQAGFADGIVCDLDGYVTETTMANLIWRKGECLFSPKIDRAGVEGTARNYMLARAADLGLSIELGRYKMQSLLEADEVYITNAVLGIAPVRKIEEHAFSFSNLAEQLRKSYMSC